VAKTTNKNSLTLDELFGEAENKYTSLFIEVAGIEVELRPALRVDRSTRLELGKITDKMGEEVPEDEREDGIDVYRRLFTLVAATPEQGKTLVDAIGERLDVFTSLQEKWAAVTQPGEASSSES
jgi:hypothetical protein